MTSPEPPVADSATAPAHVASTPADRSIAGLLVPTALGIAVAVVLGVYGRVHEPTGVAVNIAGFSGPGYAKAWLATLAVVLAVVQVVSAMVMYGRLRVAAPPWIAVLHRWSGRFAVLATVPVAMHCLYALGFRADEPRVLVHSLLGCLFYGAFVAKMLLLTRRGLPRWALPVIGGAVFTGLVVLWLTSALWLFSARGLKI